MSVELFLGYLKNSNHTTQLKFRVVFQCAPVLKGVKLSNIVTLPIGTWQQFAEDFSESGISWQIIARNRKTEVVFLYRKRWLAEWLEQGDIRDFLKGVGYHDIRLELVLEKLQYRYQAYTGKAADFPHELGILLHYPVEDVKAFIEHGGKKSLLSGYWKVYHNAEEAQQIFLLYDKVKDKAAQEFMRGFTPQQIAVGF